MYYYIFYFDWNVFIPKLIFPKTKMFSSRKIYGLMFQNRPFVFKGKNDNFDSMVAAAFLCNYEIPVKEQLNSSVFITIYIAYTIFLVQYAYMYIECKTI